MSHHGITNGKGCAHAGLGRFGRLFQDLPPLFTHTSVIEALGRPGGLMDSDRTQDSDIPAGYTFFAQFVDHDITLDTGSQLESDQVQDVDALPNLRTPSLDLDCVYGFGPEASPHLYDNANAGKLLTGTSANPEDLARASDGTALIGDPRNDENIFVNQMQNVFIKMHNRFIDRGLNFEEAQRECRYHYQYVVLHDFLRRVCDPAIYKLVLDHLYRHAYPLCYGLDAHGKLPMPVEFSVAAYRFGHSLVRSKYSVRQQSDSGTRKKTIDLFDEQFGTGGFTPLPPELIVDWSLLLPLSNQAPDLSKAIDGKLATELNDLPFLRMDEPNPFKRSLSFRNLLRGRSLGLPSGQAAASALADCGYPIEPETLKLPNARFPSFKALSPKEQLELTTQTPLFFYGLVEGGDPNHLGPTASAILLEVFGGMLVHCGSYLQADWEPDPEIACSDHELELGDLVRYASA